MAIVICKQCGGTTISSLSLYSLEFGWFGCMAKIEEDHWVKGCAYDFSDIFSKEYADNLIGTKLPTMEDRIKSAQDIVKPIQEETGNA